MSIRPATAKTTSSYSATEKEKEFASVTALPPGRATGVMLERLKHAIETRIYAHGDQLPAERQLAVTFGAARSTVRKVLDQLEQMNLVTRRAGSGTFVNYPGTEPHNLGDVAALVSPLQLIETRFAIEPYMTRLATIHASSGDLENIESTMKRLEACNADQDLFTQLDCEFHFEVARCSRNPLIVRMYQQVNMVRLHAQWDRMKKLILTPQKIAEYNAEHRGIFEALLRRDANAAVDLITTQLEHARADLIGADRL
jgi:DNA-binding FadR family transcriptional regulator